MGALAHKTAFYGLEKLAVNFIFGRFQSLAETGPPLRQKLWRRGGREWE